jgi:hypothetical protein
MPRTDRAGWRRSASLLPASIVLLVLTGVAVLALSTGENQAGKAGAADANALRQHFRIFRSNAEGLPFTLRKFIGPPETHPLPGRAQRLPADGLSAWAFQAGQQLCLLVLEDRSNAAGSSCSPVRTVLARGIIISFLGAPHSGHLVARRRMIGLAPDGVTQVVIHTPGYRDRVAAVVDSVFTAEDSGFNPPESVQLKRAR